MSMRTHTIRPLIMLCCGLAMILAAPAVSYACGIPFEAQITREQAVLIDAGATHQLYASVDLDGAAPNAAVVFPIPGLPSVDQPIGSELLFTYLEEATRPEIVEEPRLIFARGPDETAGGAPGGVALLGREVIGGYDVARLSADDGNELLNWLTENGYALPPAAAPILAAYSDEGWSFVAVRLADAAPNGSLAPLRISYPAENLIYPMRLGSLSDRPVAVDLYVLSANKVEVPELTLRYAGPVAELEPPPSPELAAILNTATYLTRLGSDDLDPSTLNSDFLPRPAADNEAYRAQEIIETPVYLFAGSALLACSMALVLFTSSMAIVGAFYFRRRIDALSPEP